MSNQTPYVWRAEAPGAALRWSLFWLALAALAAGALFAYIPGSPLSLTPLLGFAVWRFMPLLGLKADQWIFIGFIVLCFAIDDTSQVPWGRQLDLLTEDLGAVLFKSYGLTGMEFFAIGFSVWLILVRRPVQWLHWLRQGLPTILGVSLAIFTASLIAGAYGLATGATIQTFLIQIRFLHILPFWTFIGFVLLRDAVFAERLISVITVMIVLKSIQAVAVYFIYRDAFVGAEYLVDHYFSAFCVIAFLGLLRTIFYNGNFLAKGGAVIGFLFVLLAYILNDRRTSMVGVALALAMVPLLMPSTWLRRHFSRMLMLGALGLVFVGATWNLPPLIGFVGATFRSFGQETGGEGPSYRDLENANLFHAASSSPFTGIGYGKEFEEVYPMPDISFVYERYRMLPHNLFLASWGFGGPLTAAATSMVFVFLIGLAGRLMREPRETSLLFIGLVALFYALQYFSYTFGDIGLQINRNQMMAGIFLGGCARLLQIPQASRRN